MPSGPFELGHRSLQSGLRDWVEQQTRRPLGYIEQLYTFADRDRAGEASAHREVLTTVRRPLFVVSDANVQTAGLPAALK